MADVTPEQQVTAEVQYDTINGIVHSDLPIYRAVLHEALDEWLDNANGSGYFYVGDVTGL